MDDVADNQFIQRNFLCAVFTGDGTGGGDHCQQFFSRIPGAGFLHKAQCSGNEYHCQNDDDGQR